MSLQENSDTNRSRSAHLRTGGSDFASIDFETDLDWLAFQYVSGDLTGAELALFESLLSGNPLNSNWGDNASDNSIAGDRHTIDNEWLDERIATAAAEAIVRAVELCGAIATCESSATDSRLFHSPEIRPAVRERNQNSWFHFLHSYASTVSAASCVLLMLGGIWLFTQQPRTSPTLTSAELARLWIQGSELESSESISESPSEMISPAGISPGVRSQPGYSVASASILPVDSSTLPKLPRNVSDSDGHLRRSVPGIKSVLGIDSHENSGASSQLADQDSSLDADDDSVPAWLLAAVSYQQEISTSPDSPASVESEEVIQD